MIHAHLKKPNFKMPRCVLVCNDNRSEASAIRAAFVREGCHVITASDTRTAINRMRAYGADLVVVDNRRGYMDVDRMVDDIRHDPVYSDMPIVILGGYYSVWNDEQTLWLRDNVCPEEIVAHFN
jgi:CheY-like chemotaxis protein